ncbi:MAG: DUF1761 family protein [Alphaproteobacteria bacterium]
MMEITAGVNWLAVVVGAVAAFLLGSLWFSPMLFGKKWAAGVGVELGSAASMPVAAMVTQAIGLFLVAWVVGVTATQNALLTLILITLAFTVMAMSNGMFVKKSGYAVTVEAGYSIAVVAVMFVAQAIL